MFRTHRPLRAAAMLAAAFWPLTALADIIHVAPCGNDGWSGALAVCAAPDGPKATIQAAIDAAVNGDEIVLADGTYTGPGNRDLAFGGRAITLRSGSGDRGLCIIDCEGAGRFATFGLDDTAAIEGLTVRNGVTSGAGGGVFVGSRASASLTGCAFENCEAARFGGALAAFDASGVTAVGCAFVDNRSERGAGVYIAGAGDASFSGCDFIDNFATLGGGGLRVAEGANLTCTDSSFIGNVSAPGGGAGLLVNFVAPTSRIVGCTFRNNDATFSGAGGGFAVTSGSTIAEISDCIFEGNVAVAAGAMLLRGAKAPRVENVTFLNNSSSFGGAIIAEPGSASGFSNCLFVGNAAPSGGALEVYGPAAMTVANSTFSGNSADWGGAMGVYDAGVTLVNSVLWGDEAPAGAEILVGDRGMGGATVTVRHSDIQGGQAGVWIDGGGALVWGVGNIAADPLFVDPVAGDFRLGAGSPCIDAADNTAVPPGILTDLASLPRFIDDPLTPDTGVPGGAGGAIIVDMGAYENQACYADCDQSGSLDFFDFLCFQNQFAAGDPAADCDGSMALDFFDFLCFQNAFAAGCP